MECYHSSGGGPNNCKETDVFGKLRRRQPGNVTAITLCFWAKVYPHTAGFSGPVSASGFKDSGRLVTIFCYLNDVKQGGETRFGDLNLEVTPQKGMAVLHFPTTVGFEQDKRTIHEGRPAIDDKWLLVTWVWGMNPRDHNSIYAERSLDPLDNEII